MQWVAAMALALGLASMPALAVACPQERAVYRDRDNAYELAFQPGHSEAEAAEHRFVLKVLASHLVLDGYVMGSQPVDRTNGILFFNCPEGDVTGKDIEACTVWQGVIYGETAGRIDLLPEPGKDAATQIVLPDFGPSIRSSTLWSEGKATVVPADVLDFKECAK